ncbi:site-specific DNA-methyltransferase, partial [bacterium]|nr:site-specific DNA-methyltransferase [bacterium]
MSFNETLRSLLKSDPRFVDQDGDLLKSEVIDKAWKIDRQLIGLLLDNAQIKAKFFDEIKGHWVFNINTFIDYVQDKNFYASSYTKFRNKIG